MKRGRILCNGAILDVVEMDGKILTASGLPLPAGDISWLPPFEPRTIFALGLNYADHASELSFKAPDERLIFIKTRNALLGHGHTTRRPPDATFMHFECELAVVLGRRASRIAPEEANDCIEGYTVANDYAIRDYLENYYRPNLRVKNRDGCTPIGPWLVDAGDVSDPMALKITTAVNGHVVQQGSTSGMIFSIPKVISYLSHILTLDRGDVILTGTPHGVSNVVAGDVVVTEIESICALKNTLVAS